MAAVTEANEACKYSKLPIIRTATGRPDRDEDASNEKDLERLMDILEAIRTRKSIRGFKPDPVPKEVIAEVLSAARRAPSSVNTQPWEVAVVTGGPLEELKKANVELFEVGYTPTQEVKFGPHSGVFRQRQIDLAVRLFQLMGIEREDKAKRAEWSKKGYRFFDAPAAIIVAVDRLASEASSLFDAGAFVQTVTLAALHFGLGTCIQGQGVMSPETVRRITGIPDTKRLIISVAIGYPDWDFPANRLETARQPLEGFVTWCGFQ